MRRPSLPAALLLSALCFACAHSSADTIGPARAAPDSAELEHEAAAETLESEATDTGATDTGATVISFEDTGGDTLDTVIAPPKREQIPGFELFGTGETASTEGPKLTLPPDME